MDPSLRFYDSVEFPQRRTDQYKHIFFLRNFFQKPDLFESQMEEIEQALAEEMSPLEDDHQAIECYAPEEMSIDKLKTLYTDDIRPIVLKGYAKEHDCVKQWTPEYFKDKYGDFQIFYTSTDKIINDDGTILRDFVDDVIAGSKSRAYIENLSDIFNEYPELHDQLGLDKVAGYLGDYASYHKIAQLFFGGPGTGAVYHCANELNCFLNIYGEKQWTFVHPKYSIAMYATLMNKGYFVGSLVKDKAPRKFIEAEYPLYNRIPKLRITLEPGDMLINPPWWWHTIKNMTPATISVATRWGIEPDYIRQSPLFEFVQSMRMERWTSFDKDFLDKVVVVPDKEIRKNYVAYDQMGWVAKAKS